MFDQEQPQTNPLGPLASVAAQLVPQDGDSIKPAVRNPLLKAVSAVTDPDTDGRRSYSASYGSSFAAAQPTVKTPANGNPLAEAVQQPAAQVQTAAGNPLAAAVGRDASGVITAESALAAQGNPMTRVGGISGSTDMKGVNEILTRENKARGEMINSMIAANGGNGVAILGDENAADKANAEKTQRWRQDELLQQASRGNQSAVAAAIHANAQTESEAGRNAMSALIDGARNTVTMRGQDINAKSADARLAGNPLVAELNKAKIQGAQIENGQSQRLNDLQQQLVAETDPAKQKEIAGQIRALNGRTEQRTDDTLSLPQRRSNFEIDAARERIAGLSAQEIQKRTAKTTNTGRENPDFDPLLERAVTLANRRKYGTDEHFDQRQQAQQPAGTDGDTATRFRADQAMQGHKLGKQTDQGTEVFDNNGRLIGHYR